VSPRLRGARAGGSVRWGEPRPGIVLRLAARVRGLFGERRAEIERLPALPAVLRRGDLAASYLAAEDSRDHRRAAAAAAEASERAIDAAQWWPADAWAHRALWHFEQAQMELHAARAARRIGDVRVLGGDAASARRYYAEAISEARDLGAEREEGLAALGMGRAELELGSVTTARRLAQIAVDLLERCGAPSAEIAAARELRGTEKPVGASREEAE
jgi:tetratricopeptide (TPR) repeat protein